MDNNIVLMNAFNSDETIQVLNSFWEDHLGRICFYYCGKDSVLGFSHPNYIFKNEDDHNYGRIALYVPVDTDDDTLYVYINETLDIMTIVPTYLQDTKLIEKMKNYKVHVEGFAKAGRILKETVKCTVTNCNLSYDENFINIILTEDSFLGDDSKTRYSLGVWLDISDMEYVMTNIDKSLSVNSVPINAEHFPSSYTAEYLNNDTKENEINLLNVEDLLRGTDRFICDAIDQNNTNNERLTEIEEKTKYEPHQFNQNTIVYNPTYVPTAAKVEEVVQGTSIIAPVLDRILTLDPVNKCFTVKEDGIYALQLKNGFYLVQGETRVDINVYINDEQIKEMKISAYLKSNPDGQDDEGKVIKNTYSSNTYVTRLYKNDKVYLKTTWMNTDVLVFENETMISVTALQYNVPN